eukprot:1146804-Pelagomonas_calceolata.AAC.4
MRCSSSVRLGCARPGWPDISRLLHCKLDATIIPSCPCVTISLSLHLTCAAQSLCALIARYLCCLLTSCDQPSIAVPQMHCSNFILALCTTQTWMLSHQPLAAHRGGPSYCCYFQPTVCNRYSAAVPHMPSTFSCSVLCTLQAWMLWHQPLATHRGGPSAA